MATHSSVLAWRIPGMGEPGGLPSMGSHRVGYDWSDLAVFSNYIDSSLINGLQGKIYIKSKISSLLHIPFICKHLCFKQLLNIHNSR